MTREKGFTLVINSNLEQFLKLWGYTLRKIPERPPRGPRGERKNKENMNAMPTQGLARRLRGNCGSPKAQWQVSASHDPLENSANRSTPKKPMS